jgi:hypothetical protein
MPFPRCRGLLLTAVSVVRRCREIVLLVVGTPPRVRPKCMLSRQRDVIHHCHDSPLKCTPTLVCDRITQTHF